MRLLRLWFSLDQPVSRRAYALSGFGLAGLKYAVEALVVWSVTGAWFTPLAYLSPLLSSRQAALGRHDWLLLALAAWTLPFLWIGVSMSWRRAEDAGLHPLLAALFFVPPLNYFLMLTLCALPPRARPREPRAAAARGERSHGVRSALLGAGLGTAIALAMVGASVLVFGVYGTTLFAATPFVMGAVSAYVFNAGQQRSTGNTLLVAMATVSIAGGVILLFALEGVVCLAMAAPLGYPLAFMGALAGRALALGAGLARQGVAGRPAAAAARRGARGRRAPAAAATRGVDGRRDRRAARAGLAARTRVLPARGAAGLVLPAGHRVSARRHDRGAGPGSGPALRVLHRRVRRADHRVGRAAPAGVRRGVAAARDGRAQPVSGSARSASGRLLAGAARRVPADPDRAWTHAPRGAHLLRAARVPRRLLDALVGRL
jgi:hypothetical protein